MAWATFLIVKCPCRKLLSCHLAEAITATAVAYGIVYYENYIV